MRNSSYSVPTPSFLGVPFQSRSSTRVPKWTCNHPQGAPTRLCISTQGGVPVTHMGTCPLTLERLIARHVQGPAFSHFLDDLLHHVAVLEPPVAGVQLHVVVAGDSGEVHLETSRARLPGQHQSRISWHPHSPGFVFFLSLRDHTGRQNVFTESSVHACMCVCMYVPEHNS